MSIKKRIKGFLVTHEDREVKDLENCYFSDSEKVMRKLSGKDYIDEVVVLQTCNRVEVYAVVSEDSENGLKRFLEAENPDFLSRSVYVEGEDFLNHILRLSSGLKSLVVGEDQILGQIKKAFGTGLENDVTGKALNTALEKSIRVGKRVRDETGINRGPRSVGSAAVKLSEKIFGSLEGKNVVVVGAGEVSELVCRSLVKKTSHPSRYLTRTSPKVMIWLRRWGLSSQSSHTFQNICLRHNL